MFADKVPETGIGIKRAGMLDSVPREELEARIKNIAQAKRDPAWWAENFFHIITLDKGLTKIKLYPKQKELLSFIADNTRVLTLASRQTGKCVFRDTAVEARDKKTAKTFSISALELYSRLKSQQKVASKKIMSSDQCCNCCQHATKKKYACKKQHGATSCLSQQVQRKFIDSVHIEDLQVKTDGGWTDAVCMHKTVPYKIWQVRTSSHSLKCADDHIVFKAGFQEVFVKDLAAGDKILTDAGLEEVCAIEQSNEEDCMYDIELGCNSSHRYYTNGVLSHNTTTYTVFCLWYATMFQDKKIMICANKLATAIEIMDRIRKAYENLPFWIKPGILTYNKGEVAFANGSTIRACSTSSSAARGSSCNCLVLDEMAFIPQNIIDEFFASVIPVVSSSKNSKIIAVSTPNGASGLYYELWQKANSKDARGNTEGWKPFRINWWEAGGVRDEQWKRQQIASIGLEKWKQEFECDFLTSATSRMVPDDILEKYRMALSELKASNKAFYLGKQHKIMSENEDKVYEFTMWHEFDQDHTYAASGDVAEGGGGDESVLYVWDISDLKCILMCAKFSSNKVSPTEFAYVTKKILALYGDPYYICERNGLGSGYLDSLRITYKYDNIVREAKNNEIGIASHAMTKSKACLWTKDMMTTAGFGFKLYDKDLVDELGTFCKKDNKGIHLTYCALPNCHDDHVMALIWLCWLLQSDVIERYFSVYKTFTSSLGNVYAELVAPIKPYESCTVKHITDDPIYQDFLDFKEDLQNKLGKMLDQQKQAAPDLYFGRDQYFGDFDQSPTWTNASPASQSAAGLNQANFSRPFFVF